MNSLRFWPFVSFFFFFASITGKAKEIQLFNTYEIEPGTKPIKSASLGRVIYLGFSRPTKGAEMQLGRLMAEKIKKISYYPPALDDETKWNGLRIQTYSSYDIHISDSVGFKFDQKESLYKELYDRMTSGADLNIVGCLGGHLEKVTPQFAAKNLPPSIKPKIKGTVSWYMCGYRACDISQTFIDTSKTVLELSPINQNLMVRMLIMPYMPRLKY